MKKGGRGEEAEAEVQRRQAWAEGQRGRGREAEGQRTMAEAEGQRKRDRDNDTTVAQEKPLNFEVIQPRK